MKEGAGENQTVGCRPVSLQGQRRSSLRRLRCHEEGGGVKEAG